MSLNEAASENRQDARTAYGSMRMENHEGNHFKFYELRLFGRVNGVYILEIHFGRIGTFGQHKQFCGSYNQMRAKIAEVIETRVAHGYSLVGAPTLNI